MPHVPTRTQSPAQQAGLVTAPTRDGAGQGGVATGKYRTIVADPPWPVDWGAKRIDGKMPFGSRRGTLPYRTMTIEEIAALPVPDIADDAAHLYLWTINAYVEAAYSVARAWGFTPSTLLVWAKTPKGRGLGGTFSTATEYVLFARRGALSPMSRVDRNWWQWQRREHSAKPEAFIDMVEQVSPPPYVELFARRHRLGWDVWGNESANTATMEVPA